MWDSLGAVALLAVGVGLGIMADRIKARWRPAERDEDAVEAERRTAYRALAEALDPIWLALRRSEQRLNAGQLPTEPSNWRDLVVEGADAFVLEWHRSELFLMGDKRDRELHNKLRGLGEDVWLLGTVAKAPSEDPAHEAKVLGDLFSRTQDAQMRLRTKAIHPAGRP